MQLSNCDGLGEVKATCGCSQDAQINQRREAWPLRISTDGVREADAGGGEGRAATISLLRCWPAGCPSGFMPADHTVLKQEFRRVMCGMQR